MAEDKISDIDDGTIVDGEKSKVDQEVERLRDSDDISGGSFSEGEDNGQRRLSDDQKQKKGRRPRRLKGGKRHNRKHHPYAGTSYSATKGGEPLQCPHAPRNTTQFLIDDHVRNNISPDLSNRPSPASSFDESTEVGRQGLETQKERRKALQDFPNLPVIATGESPHYDQEFVAVYDDVGQDQLRNMSKEDLVSMTARLLKTVASAKLTSHHGKEEIDIDKMRDSPSATPLSSCN